MMGPCPYGLLHRLDPFRTGIPDAAGRSPFVRPRSPPAYVADWPDLPDWQKETDADIFETIEATAQ
ncbi:hypothetical protein GCM10027091_43750 [Streptomyces daliensis]